MFWGANTLTHIKLVKLVKIVNLILKKNSETSEKAFPPDNHSNFPDQNFPDQDFRTEEEDRGQ